MAGKSFNRWWIVAAGVLGCAAGAGIVATFAVGLFVSAISAEYGWGRSLATAGLTCFFLVSGLGSMIFGSLIQRWTLRRATISFVSLFAFFVASVGFLPKSLLLFCLAFSLMGLFGAAATAMPFAVAIADRFDRDRGLAMAVVVSGSGLGGLLMPHYANWLLENYGWRGGYIGIGVIVAIVSLPLTILFLRNPEAVTAARDAHDTPTFRQIYTSGPAIWLIALGIFCSSLAIIGVITNIPVILTDSGETPARAAAMVGFVSAASWITRLGLGILLDRMHVRYLASTIFASSALGIGLFAIHALGLVSFREGLWLYLACGLIGLGIGAEMELISYTVSRYFPVAFLGKALGAAWIFFAWGGGLGVFTGSICFDLTGSYDAVLWLYTALAVIGAALFLKLGPYRFAAPGH